MLTGLMLCCSKIISTDLSLDVLKWSKCCIQVLCMRTHLYTMHLAETYRWYSCDIYRKHFIVIFFSFFSYILVITLMFFTWSFGSFIRSSKRAACVEQSPRAGNHSETVCRETRKCSGLKSCFDSSAERCTSWAGFLFELICSAFFCHLLGYLFSPKNWHACQESRMELVSSHLQVSVMVIFLIVVL